MKLKTVEIDGKTYAEVADGKPVFVHNDGKEVGFDAVGASAKIGELTNEAKNHRVAKEKAEGDLKGFEGLNIEDAKAALEKVKNLSTGELKTAAQVEEITREAKRAAEEQVAAAARASAEKLKQVEGERDSFRQGLHSEKIANAFKGSKYMAEHIAVPADMVQSTFGSRFAYEDNKIVAHDASGNKMFSRANPGSLAEFDEALEMMVDGSSYRDQILKGSGSSGGGAQGGSKNGGGGNTMTRASFEKMTPAAQMEFSDKAGAQIVD